jgi:hypothetical protein
MSWSPVTPKYGFLEWTGSNLDDWRVRWPNAWVTADGLWYGPTVGPVQIGGGMVEGPCLQFPCLTPADVEAAFTRNDVTSSTMDRKE